MNCCRHCPTVAAGGGNSHPLACRPLIDFRSFRPLLQSGEHWHPSDAENSRNRSNLAILPVTLSRVALLPYPQPSTKLSWPLDPLQQAITLRRATAGCRRVGAQERGSWARTPRVFNPRSRVLALLVAARGRGNTRVCLIVVDSERARPRKMITGRMANFDRFLLFSASS